MHCSRLTLPDKGGVASDLPRTSAQSVVRLPILMGRRPARTGDFSLLDSDFQSPTIGEHKVFWETGWVR
jgi:hypothetical protein